jgi:hypothetical protein
MARPITLSLLYTAKVPNTSKTVKIALEDIADRAGILEAYCKSSPIETEFKYKDHIIPKTIFGTPDVYGNGKYYIYEFAGIIQW